MSRMERTERATGLRFALPVVGSAYPSIAGKPGTQWLADNQPQAHRRAP